MGTLVTSSWKFKDHCSTVISKKNRKGMRSKQSAKTHNQITVSSTLKVQDSLPTSFIKKRILRSKDHAFWWTFVFKEFRKLHFKSTYHAVVHRESLISQENYKHSDSSLLQAQMKMSWESCSEPISSTKCGSGSVLKLFYEAILTKWTVEALFSMVLFISKTNLQHDYFPQRILKTRCEDIKRPSGMLCSVLKQNKTHY